MLSIAGNIDQTPFRNIDLCLAHRLRAERRIRPLYA